MVLTLLFSAIAHLAAEPLYLRVVAGNLSSGRYQKYDEGHGARILQGLKPDIALLQEFRVGESSDREITSWVKSVFGPAFFFYRQDKELPNGIVSKYPIVASGFWPDEQMPNRDFAWARIELPGKKKILVVSLHISASDGAKRRAETKALAEYCQKNLLPGEWLIIGGDFNTQVRNESCMQNLASLVEIGPPFPADETGNENTNSNRRKPTDWLLTSKDLQVLAIPNRLTNQGDLVFDTRVFGNLSLVPHAMKSDSAAEQMQHMAVVRDFLIPEAGATQEAAQK